MSDDPNAKYDMQRCRCCGHPWRPWKDEHGRVYRGHPPNDTCYRHRPKDVDPGAAMAAVIHGDGEVAHVPSIFLTGMNVMDGPVHANGEGH